MTHYPIITKLLFHHMRFSMNDQECFSLIFMRLGNRMPIQAEIQQGLRIADGLREIPSLNSVAGGAPTYIVAAAVTVLQKNLHEKMSPSAIQPRQVRRDRRRKRGGQTRVSYKVL